MAANVPTEKNKLTFSPIKVSGESVDFYRNDSFRKNLWDFMEKEYSQPQLLFLLDC